MDCLSHLFISLILAKKGIATSLAASPSALGVSLPDDLADRGSRHLLGLLKVDQQVGDLILLRRRKPRTGRDAPRGHATRACGAAKASRRSSRHLPALDLGS